MERSFGNMSQDEAREALGIPPEAVAQPVVDFGALSYTGNAGRLLAVLATEDGLEFRALTASEITVALGTFAQGDLIYASAANTLAALAKDATATRYLSNTGTSNNPAWAQIDLTNGVTGILPAGNGGTGNGFFAVTGPTTSTRTFTFPNASDTVACLGQANAFTKQVTINNTTVGQTGFVGGGQSGARIVADFNGGNLNFSDAATFLFRSNGGGTTFLTINSSAINATVDFQRSGTKVVGARKTGWATATGTATRTTFDTASVTLPQLAERLKALIDDLHGTAGHGLIGT